MSFSDEDLIDYLMGEMEPEARAHLEFAMSVDLDLRSRFERLQQCLNGASFGDEELFEPPAGLVDRTLEAIEQETEVQETAKVRLSATERPRRWRGLPIWDNAVLACSALVFCSLLLQGLLQGRSLSRQLGCSENLLSLGQDLEAFSTFSFDRRIPEIPKNGPNAFPGNFALLLRERGLLVAPQVLHCPSMMREEDCNVMIPTPQQFASASAEQVRNWRRTIAANYAYNLGVMERGASRAPTARGRSYFAWLGDAPTIQVVEQIRYPEKQQGGNSVMVNLRDDAAPVFRSESLSSFGSGSPGVEPVAAKLIWLAHDGRGINVLYEDGHVSFVRLELLDPSLDHPYFNRKRCVETGVDCDDASLGSNGIAK